MPEKLTRIQTQRFLLPAYLIMLPVIFVLPFFSAAGYSLLRHTTSQLGAQNTPNAWIMNTVFCLLGAASLLEAWLRLKDFWVHKLLLTAFGAGLIMTALFHHAPIGEIILSSPMEDTVHSVFATVVGFAFTLFAFAASFIEITTKRGILALATGLTAIFFSLLMQGVPELAGLWQRSMFILSFAWLIFFLEAMKLKQA